MPLTQENRSLQINTVLGENVLLITGLSVSEGISMPFSYELSLISENQSISFPDIIGTTVTVSISLESGERRYFNGLVSRFSQVGGGSEEGADEHHAYYSATIVPWLWLLTKTVDSRIFQELTIPEIVEQIFTEKDFLDYKLKLQGSYEKRNYCVQYRESDFNFVSRLMEEEGIYYYFEHEDGKHTLVILDSPEEHKPCPNQESARYHRGSAGILLEEDTISSLNLTQEITPGKYTINDYNFETPNTDLKIEVPSGQSLGPGEREIYDYPGGYGKRAEGDRLGNIRIQEEEADITIITGSSNCRAFTSGYKFTLRNYYRDEMNDEDYVLTAISCRVDQPYLSGEGETGLSYSNSFTCIPFSVQYRPFRNTPKPVVEGVQTAIIVGPKGEEIYPDKYGRVKVQFHWDREGKKDEKSSCWIRVSQLWAGAGWGAMHVPHVGHEVIVDFIEGDPDRPVITGRLYHGNNMPPDELPGEKTKNVFRSWGDNDIVIEDKDGDKSILIKQANGNEIKLHESSPNIEIKQECGNEMIMTADGPKINVKQECGNEMVMDAGGPDIEIKQACGNHMTMKEADGIQLMDKFGNEMTMDASSGFIHIASPSHNSFIDIGKSLKWGTNSDGEWLVLNDGKFTVQGNTHESFVGTKTALSAALDVQSVNGVVIKRYYAYENAVNYQGRNKRTKGPVKVDSDTSYNILGGADDVAQIILDNAGSIMFYDGENNSIKIDNNGIEINTPKKLTLDANEIVIKSKGNIDLKPKGKVTIPKGHYDFGDADG